MADRSTIEWTDATWNPVTGCTKVSPGCDHCYAETFAERWRGTPGHHFENGFDVQLRPEKLEQPLRWKKPRKVFVNSMSDLFHDDVPEDYIAQVWTVMAATPQHTYQILTKRHARMRSVVRRIAWRTPTTEERQQGVRGPIAYVQPNERLNDHLGAPDVLPNVWLGVSTEDQRWADIRIPALLQTPAAVRWISAEPLLGPINLDQPRCDDHGRREVVTDDHGREWCGHCSADGFTGELSFGHWLDPLNGGLNWVVAGGESGPGARPMHPAWARTLRDQCAEAGVPFLFKQWGEFVPVAVEDAPNFAGGRAYRHPRFGRIAASILEHGPSGTFRNGVSRAMRPGDRTKGAVMLDEDTVAARVGKKEAGRELDGQTWDQFPAAAAKVA